jgi:hypothetical protein
MTTDPKSNQSSREVDRRFARALRNLLGTPHKPHEKGSKTEDDKGKPSTPRKGRHREKDDRQ